MAKLKYGEYQADPKMFEINPVTGLTDKVNSGTQPIKAGSQTDVFGLAKAASQEYSFTPDEDFGESQYDVGLYSEEVFNLNQARAERQSTGAKWGNAAAKMGITALTTIADGTIGTILGLTNIDGEDKNGNPLSDFVNNPFSQAMLDIGEWSEKALPNYYTQQEQDNPWYENLDTANFWADKVLKNFGFAIGAYVSGALTAGAGSYLTGANKLARGMSSKIGKGLMTKLLTGSADEATEKAILTELATRGTGVTDDLVKGLISEGKKLKKLSLQNQIIGSVGGSVVVDVNT